MTEAATTAKTDTYRWETQYAPTPSFSQSVTIPARLLPTRAPVLTMMTSEVFRSFVVAFAIQLVKRRLLNTIKSRPHRSHGLGQLKHALDAVKRQAGQEGYGQLIKLMAKTKAGRKALRRCGRLT